ncbi:MAG: carboxypeptidase regulatory-like domain-containing protein [Bacteroidota bacterium]
MKNFRGVFLLFILNVLLSCDAPRINPLDPLGQDYKFAELDGTVYTAELPKRAIPDVVVTWENQNVTVKTDSNGNYRITDIPRVNGNLHFEKPGLSKFTILIDWQNRNYVKVGVVELSSTIGNIDGYLYTTDQTPIANAKVFWKNQKVTTKTDAVGYFLIDAVPLDKGWIFFEKEGYKADSLFIEWKDQKLIRLERKILEYNIGDIEGRVLNSNSQPLEKVAVKWSGVPTTTYITESNGRYKFSNVPIQNGKLFFEKDSYKTDTLDVQWKDIKVKVVADYKMRDTHGDLEGKIYYLDKPNIGVPNVFVHWSGTSTVAQTNAEGNFKFSNIPITSGALVFEKEGFKKDTIQVQWESGRIRQVFGYIKYRTGTLTGVVRKDRSSPIFLSGVKVYWKNQNIVKITNTNGEYTIPDIPMNDGFLFFEKAGYSPDSVFVQWGIQNTIAVRDVRLNAIPVLDNIDIYSVVTNKFPDEFKTKRMNVEAKVSDEENDIDSVYIQCKPLNVLRPLAYNISTKSFQRELNTAELNVNYLDEVIGKNFDVVVKDAAGKKFTLGPSQLKRVISQQFRVFSPQDGAKVGSQPIFTWQNINLEFNFRYYIEVYTDEIPATLIWTSSRFSKDIISFTVNTNLPKGDYFWIIWSEDDFRNRASSRPATFTVQ